jgi:hypothetical protein
MINFLYHFAGVVVAAIDKGYLFLPEVVSIHVRQGPAESEFSDQSQQLSVSGVNKLCSDFGGQFALAEYVFGENSPARPRGRLEYPGLYSPFSEVVRGRQSGDTGTDDGYSRVTRCMR